MNAHVAVSETAFLLQSSLLRMLRAGGLAAILFLAALPARAADAPVPWECSNYEGTAQIRCLNTFIEFQRDRISQLEGELHAQRGTVGQLKELIDRQTAVTSELEKKLSERPATAIFPAPSYPYISAYPPTLGLGLHFGPPWRYGPAYSFHPHWGLRPYRTWWFRF
ncbi:MAG TPA: hypothetical protein VD738_00195 [Nitrospira sp.]|nr:hypothetical protein [Nitrospira sp.]